MSLHEDVTKLAHEHPELRKQLLPLLRQAAYPREGLAKIRLGTNNFKLYYQQRFSPTGLAAEEMPKMAKRVRDSMRTFIERLGAGLGVPLKPGAESTYVLLGVEERSITFNVEVMVNTGRKTLTADLIMDLESPVFDRFGYQVEIL